MIHKNSVSLERGKITFLSVPSLSPGFSYFSRTRSGECTGLTLFQPFNIFLLTGYNQSQPDCIFKNCSDYLHLPKEEKQVTLGFSELYTIDLLGF